MYIWKRSYSPFQMGGNVNKKIKTNITDYQEVELAKGFKGIYIEGQGVFELESGGLIGNTVEEVIADINSCDSLQYLEVMKKQVEAAKEEGLEAIEVSNEEFFK